MKAIKKNNMRILLTGGHAGSTSYAVIERLRKKKEWEIYFIGGKSSLEGEKVKTLSEINLKKLNIKYYSLYTGRLQRKFSIWTIPSIIKVPIGFVHALFLLKKIKPKVVLSFGGYAAYPVVVVSWMLKIPVIIHEQTAVAGRANMLSSRFARVVALSRNSSSKYFDNKKCILVGNPISSGITKISTKKRKEKPSVLLVTGGASGSVTINNLLDEVLDSLLVEYYVIHQVGELQFKYFKKRKSGMNESRKKKYEIYSIIPSAEWPTILTKADIVVSRSGANIVSEIIAAKKPSILIPLPFSYLDEQRKNALYAQRKNIAKVFDQDDVTGKILFQEIEQINKSWNDIMEDSEKVVSPDTDAAQNLVGLLEKIIDEEEIT